VSTVRPPIFPNQASPAQGASRNAGGQRAFFAAAAAAPASAAEITAPAPVQRMPAALPAEPPEKILRPGSLLDIWV